MRDVAVLFLGKDGDRLKGSREFLSGNSAEENGASGGFEIIL